MDVSTSWLFTTTSRATAQKGIRLSSKHAPDKRTAIRRIVLTPG
jgi:hypothetical protein